MINALLAAVIVVGASLAIPLAFVAGASFGRHMTLLRLATEYEEGNRRAVEAEYSEIAS